VPWNRLEAYRAEWFQIYLVRLIYHILAGLVENMSSCEDPLYLGLAHNHASLSQPETLMAVLHLATNAHGLILQLDSSSKST
jgi:hypothetical protein